MKFKKKKEQQNHVFGIKNRRFKTVVKVLQAVGKIV